MLISVVVAVRDPGDALLANVAALDDQLLSTERWEAVYVDGASTDTTPDRLERLTGHRPNVRVVTLDRGAGRAALLDAGIRAASGDWVVLIDVTDRLTPFGLLRLAELLDERHEAGAPLDVVVGRSVDSARRAVEETLFAAGRTEPEADRLPAALLSPFVAYRRGFLSEHTLSFTPSPTSSPTSSSTPPTAVEPVGVDLGSTDPAAPPADALPLVQFALQATAGGPVVGLLADDAVLDGEGLLATTDPDALWRDTLRAVSTVPDLSAAGLGEVLAGRLVAGVLAADTPEWVVDTAGPGLRGLERRLTGAGARDAVVLDLVGRGEDELTVRVIRSFSTLRLGDVQAEAAWTAGTLRITASGRIALDSAVLADLRRTGIDPEGWFSSAAARIGLRNRPTTAVHLLAGDSDLRLDGTDVQFHASASLDPLTRAAGGVLPAAAYQVVVEVVGLGWGPVPQSVLPSTLDLPAVLDGTLVSVRGVGSSGLHVDVGPVRRSLLGPIDPGQTSVSESARGSLLTIALPGLEHRGTARVPGHVIVGSFALPGELVVDDHPRVEAYVSGIPGRVPLATRFGRAAMSQTGCDLVITPTGGFTVVRTEPAPSSPVSAPTGREPKSEPARSRPKPPPRSGALAELRRAIPAPLEPAVRRLAAHPQARALYRRLTR